MSLDSLLCALIPVFVIAGVIVRGILISRRRRGAVRDATPIGKDDAVQAYEAGRNPIEADKWWGPGL
jgi:NADH:ubiquinone oxidoreductase subunit 3 (subunit A)